MFPKLRRAVHSGSSWKIQDGGEQETTQGRRPNLILFISQIKKNHMRRRDEGVKQSLARRKGGLMVRWRLIGVGSSGSLTRWLGSLRVSKHEGGTAPVEAAGL